MDSRKSRLSMFTRYPTPFLLNVVRQSISRMRIINEFVRRIIHHLIERNEPNNDEITWLYTTFVDGSSRLIFNRELNLSSQPFKDYYRYYSGFTSEIPKGDLPPFIQTIIARRYGDATLLNTACKRGDAGAAFFIGFSITPSTALMYTAAERGDLRAMRELGWRDLIWEIRNFMFGSGLSFGHLKKLIVVASDIYVAGKEIDGYVDECGNNELIPELQEANKHYLTVSHSARRAALQSVILLTRPLGRDVARLIGKLIYSQRGSEWSDTQIDSCWRLFAKR